MSYRARPRKSPPRAARTKRARQRRPGLTIILTGRIDTTQHDESGHRRRIVTHGPGSFMGELAQLAGRPALVDAHAQDEIEALIIPPERLRALLIGEAELGERVMRALILRDPSPAPSQKWSGA